MTAAGNAARIRNKGRQIADGLPILFVGSGYVEGGDQEAPRTGASKSSDMTGNRVKTRASCQLDEVTFMRKYYTQILVALTMLGSPAAASGPAIKLQCTLLSSSNVAEPFKVIQNFKIDPTRQQIDVWSAHPRDGWTYANRPDDLKIGGVTTIQMAALPDGAISASGLLLNDPWAIRYDQTSGRVIYVGVRSNQPENAIFNCQSQ